MQVKCVARGMDAPLGSESLDTWCAVVRTELLETMLAHAREVTARLDKGEASVQDKIASGTTWFEEKLQQGDAAARMNKEAVSLLEERVARIEASFHDEREARASENRSFSDLLSEVRCLEQHVEKLEHTGGCDPRRELDNSEGAISTRHSVRGPESAALEIQEILQCREFLSIQESVRELQQHHREHTDEIVAVRFEVEVAKDRVDDVASRLTDLEASLASQAAAELQRSLRGTFLAGDVGEVRLPQAPDAHAATDAVLPKELPGVERRSSSPGRRGASEEDGHAAERAAAEPAERAAAESPAAGSPNEGRARAPSERPRDARSPIQAAIEVSGSDSPGTLARDQAQDYEWIRDKAGNSWLTSSMPRLSSNLPRLASGQARREPGA